MKILILSGFLGSGKTSLLLSLARFLAREAKEGDAPRVIILENEVGAQGVDDSLLRSNGLEVENLFAGCACCTVGTELISAVTYIEETLAPDWIILETTGLAYPGLIRENLLTALKKESRISTVVDVSRWARIKKPMQTLLEGQISCADVVLINKTDLASEAQIAECETDIRSVNADALCIRTSAVKEPDDSIWQVVLEGSVSP